MKKVVTEPLFFDTDCLSSFLWVKREDIFLDQYSGKINLPEAVFVELSNPRIPHLKNRVLKLWKAGNIKITKILANTEEFELYYKFTLSPIKGQKRIGKGEAAALALAKVYNGIIASNNLKDISHYIKLYGLKHVTTGSIMTEALNRKYINESMGNQIWSEMIRRRRMLPTKTFTDYLKLC